MCCCRAPQIPVSAPGGSIRIVRGKPLMQLKARLCENGRISKQTRVHRNLPHSSRRPPSSESLSPLKPASGCSSRLSKKPRHCPPSCSAGSEGTEPRTLLAHLQRRQQKRFHHTVTDAITKWCRRCDLTRCFVRDQQRVFKKPDVSLRPTHERRGH